MSSSEKFNPTKSNVISNVEDRDNFAEFLSINKGKKVVVVQGLGFVGAVMALVCANAIGEEYAVIGVDLPNLKSSKMINDLNGGKFPLVADDPKIDEFFKNAQKKKNFYATTDINAYRYADIIIIDINLDVQKLSNTDMSLNSFDVDMSAFERAISTIGSNCKEDVLVIVETTIPPGTCKNLLYPILCNEFDKRNINKKLLKVAHSYERVMPGPEYINSIREFPRVYSGINDSSADAAEVFLSTIIDTEKCALTRLENTTATEMAKVLENSYRATNIAFAVEWTRFAEEAGVNLWEIVNAIRIRKTHANLMFPNVGVGGYCLTKDPLLASWARKSFFDQSDDLFMSVNSVSTNDQMPVFAYKRLRSVFGDLKDKKIAFWGVSYRGDVGDTRFTPVQGLYELVSMDTKDSIIHDPFVNFWEELGLQVFDSVEPIFEFNPELLIFSTAHSIYKQDNFVDKILNLKPLNIFDSVGLFNECQIQSLSTRHRISVIGRGDIS